MLRRIGLLLADSDPVAAATVIGAGTARSLAGTLTQRVQRHHDERVALIEAAIGAERCAALMREGAAMSDHAAVAFARAAADRCLGASGVATSDPLR